MQLLTSLLRFLLKFASRTNGVGDYPMVTFWASYYLQTIIGWWHEATRSLQLCWKSGKSCCVCGAGTLLVMSSHMARLPLMSIFSQYFAMKLPSEEFLGTLVFQHWVVKSFLMAAIRLRSLRELGNFGGCSQNTLPFCATILRLGQRGL